MVSRGIREFVGRDWALARRSKEIYWRDRIARLGPVEAFRIADELRREVLVLNPMWPDAEQRRLDVASHVRVAELFRRAGPARGH
jgi:hypothetical protein